MNVIAIFDVGKTNKKLLLFDEQYRIVTEQSASFPATTDDDGESCEDLRQLTRWIRVSLDLLLARDDIRVRAINFSAYGASFVHIGKDGQPAAPLYNYLKPYPEALQQAFYRQYGGEVALSMLTASPVLGSLNSGMQLYRILKERPELFGSIKCSLHLPQYCSYLLTGNPVSDITSIGCHTNLWNYGEQRYHAWVYRAGLIEKLAPIVSSDTVFPLVAVQQEGGTEGVAAATAGRSGEWSGSDPVLVGVGLHDSSAAIIPYLESYRDPFVLISTGTWCITMNPFNDSPLTAAELQQDCLCYLSYKGRPVKASRLFAGRDHEVQVRRLVAYFHREPESAATVGFDPACVERLRAASPVKGSVFGRRELKAFESFEEAYHCLMMDIMDQQVVSTGLVLRGTGVRRIFVDGGFGRNEVYMRLLAAAFPEMEVSAATIPQATAMGAALAIHAHWNDQVLPRDLIELKSYR